MWEGIKCGFSKDEYRRDGRHFCVICRLVCLCLCGRARKGDIYLVVTKDRVGVSSHLTPLSCKPLDPLLQNRYFIPVRNYFLSRFFNRDYPSGTNVSVFLSRQLFNRDKCLFSQTKKNQMASFRLCICKPVLQIKKFIQNCNFKIKI